MAELFAVALGEFCVVTADHGVEGQAAGWLLGAGYLLQRYRTMQTLKG